MCRGNTKTITNSLLIGCRKIWTYRIKSANLKVQGVFLLWGFRFYHHWTRKRVGGRLLARGSGTYTNEWKICMHWIDCAVRWQVLWWHVIIDCVMRCCSLSNVFLEIAPCARDVEQTIIIWLRCAPTNFKCLQSNLFTSGGVYSLFAIPYRLQYSLLAIPLPRISDLCLEYRISMRWI